MEYTQHLNEEVKTALIYTDSRISLQLLQTHKRNTHIIDQIKNKVLDMERHEWKVEFNWVEAHAGQRGNGLAVRVAKGATSSGDIEQCYSRITKSAVTKELREQSLILWQHEWHTATKGATTKPFFPNTENRLQLRINPIPNFTAIVMGYGNLKTYLHKFETIDNPTCPCNKGDQKVDHIIYSCKLQEQERDRVKAATTRSEKWPVSKHKLALKYYDNFKRFKDNIVLNKE